MLATVLAGAREIPPGEVLLASPDGATTHREIFDAATLLHRGRRRRPLHIPRLLCAPGIAAQQVLGSLIGQRPFERPWMARYVDTRMTVDARRTRERLDWTPRPRLELLRRLPVLLENRKLDPHEWGRRNQARMEPRPMMGHLAVHALLDAHQDEIARTFTAALRGPDGPVRFPSYQQLTLAEHEWYHRLLLRHLVAAVRTRDAAVFAAYCHDLANHRWQQGYRSQEVCAALEELNRICFQVLRRDPASNTLRQQLQDYVTMTLRIGCDRAQETLEHLGDGGPPPSARRGRGGARTRHSGTRSVTVSRTLIPRRSACAARREGCAPIRRNGLFATVRLLLSGWRQGTRSC